MPFDFKKEFKSLYLPPRKPGLIDVPPIDYLTVNGQGDPNEENGEYKSALQVLYTLMYTIKMSKLSRRQIDGYFDFVVPPLEGLWQQPGSAVFDYSRKRELCWTAMLRLPEFVDESVLEWAKGEAAARKKLDCSPARIARIDEGLCVQLLHIGSYDSEPESIQRMTDFAREAGYRMDHSESRKHHEIYLSDPNKTPADRLRTVIRLPVAPV